MQFGAPALTGVVYNTTMSRPDAALSLCLLHGLEGKREARPASVAITENGFAAAAFADAVYRMYQLGPPSNTNRVLPIGLAVDRPLPPDGAAFKAVIEKKDDKGQLVYARGVRRVPDTAEPSALMRNSLAYFPDGKVVAVLSAPATYMARMLAYAGTRELIQQKVQHLVICEGRQDAAACRRLLADWPTPVVFAGADIGEALRFPAAALEKDFAWALNHPVVDYWRAAQPAPADEPALDLAALLYAVRPNTEGFLLSEPGTLESSDAGGFRFTPGSSGKHRRLTVDSSKRDLIVATLRELVTAKPVPPPQRRRLSPEQLDELRKKREEENLKRELEERKKAASPKPLP